MGYNKKQKILLMINISFILIIGICYVLQYVHDIVIGVSSISTKLYSNNLLPGILKYTFWEMFFYSIFQIGAYIAFLLKSKNALLIILLLNIMFGISSILLQWFMILDLPLKLLMLAPSINCLLYILINSKKIRK